jgi:hypothetical protein
MEDNCGDNYDDAGDDQGCTNSCTTNCTVAPGIFGIIISECLHLFGFWLLSYVSGRLVCPIIRVAERFDCFDTP